MRKLSHSDAFRKYFIFEIPIEDVICLNYIRSVEPSNLVTSSEIARRLNRSRQSVQQWISGTRGPGSFPVPVAGLTSKTLIWNWIEVLKWVKSVDSINVEAHLKLAEWVNGVQNTSNKLR